MSTFENIFEHTFALAGAPDRGRFSKQKIEVFGIPRSTIIRAVLLPVRMDACNKLSHFIIAWLCPSLAPAVLLFVSNYDSKDQVTYAHNLVLVSFEGSSSETWSIGNTIFLHFGPRVCWSGISDNRPWREIDLAAQDSQAKFPGFQYCHYSYRIPVSQSNTQFGSSISLWHPFPIATM